MKIFVTGGAGFIGSNFILYWMKNHPHDFIVNFDNLTYAGNCENLKDIENNQNYKFIKGDICDEKLVNSVTEGIDVIVHFAAESHVDRSIIDPSIFVKTNVIGTEILLQAAKKNKIKRFHHISTDEVFGTLEIGNNDYFSEKSPYNPRSPYSASKAASDHLVRAFYYTYGLPISITNCSNNFGPYQFPEKFIPLVITNLLEGKEAPLYGDGKNIRDWLYVEDHARAIESVLLGGKIGETYCIGGGKTEITNLMVINKILNYLGLDNKYIQTVKDRPGHDLKYAVDSTKIEKELNWKPLYSFDEWLIKTIEWYKSNTSWWQHVKSGEYQKYYQLNYKNR